MTRVKNRLQRAYLLRCWQEGGLARWRFSLEEVVCKRPRRGFDSLEAMFTFLQAALAGDCDAIDDEQVDSYTHKDVISDG